MSDVPTQHNAADSPSSLDASSKADAEKGYGTDDGRNVSVTSFDSGDTGQHGVKRQEVIARTWSKKALWLGYIG